MERLTQRTEIGLSYFPKCFDEPCKGMGQCRDNDCSLIVDVCEKLAEYEDLEEQELLLRLPCKIGDTVWCVFTGCTGKHPIVMSDTFDYKMIPYFGIGCFLTRDEANKALKEMEEK